jgi:ABC-type branched-subunit amino acid transport system substrate-binding protein
MRTVGQSTPNGGSARLGGSRWRRRRLAAVLVALSLVGTACGSRLTGGALLLAEGAGQGRNAGGLTPTGNTGGTNTNANAGSTGGSSGTAGTAGTAGSAGSTAGSSASGGSGGPCAGVTSANNGGATDTGVTANQILIGNITSITGVAPGLTQSAQQATEAFADYVNSQGGICGRMLKVQAYDDGNTSSGNYSDAEQACSSDFAMVGNASGFDDGSASAVSSCGIPDVAAEVSTAAAGNTADIYGASPGNSHYWSTGPAVWLKSQYPNAVTHAAMIYLNVPATQSQATNEMNTYKTVGFNYIYTQAVSPTEPNYAPYVQTMKSDGVQYVTEYSDDNSAARLSLAMQQANFTPPVVDWFAEMYTPAFLKETSGSADGNLVLMATAPYEEASGNPGMQTFLSWMNRVAPGFSHDIFAEFAWSAGLAFLQAAEAVGPHLTRAALLQQLAKIGTWTGDGLQPPENFGAKTPSNCFSYFKINSSGNGFTRVYPSSPNSFDCTSGSLNHY